MIVRETEVDGEIVDVLLRGGAVTEIGRGLRRRVGEEAVEAGGGALIPGLHDHHLHLMAMGAAASSVDVSRELDAALRSAVAATVPGEWIRAVGYHESTGGRLDRARLDALAPDHPVRVQHRSGHAWILNTRAGGAGDGWVIDGEDELRGSWPAPVVDLATVGSRLAAFGITSVTDATPTNDPTHLAALAAAVSGGALPFRVIVTGGIGLVDHRPPAPLGHGPVKLMVPDGEGVDFDGLAASIAHAHQHGRAVALHCVSAVAAAVSVAAWAVAGSAPGDRLEHGAVLSDEVVVELRRLGVRIVTQPGFVAERGDHYLADVEADEIPHLYRCGSLIDAGLEVWGSSDAPFGPDDPWAAMRTAVDRRTSSGAVLGPGERVSPAQALAMWSEGTITVGSSAEVCLLDCSLSAALDDLDATHVVATFTA